MDLDSNTNFTGLEVAVVGMACKFPDAENINTYWENIQRGKESVRFYTTEEVMESGVKSELLNDPNYIKSNGCEIADRYGFDAEFFNYTADEAILLDPQIRLMHECIYNALTDAGYAPSDFKGNIGLFAGCSANPLWEVLCNVSGISSEIGNWSANHFMNKDFGPTLVSYKLGLKGPSVNVDTACSTSLVAVHMALKSILSGESDLAIAGGTSVSVNRSIGYLYKEGYINSPDGHCRTFDENANGIIGGEGSGMIVLKLLSKAIADNDHIYATIKGSAINNDGNRKGGFTAPSVQGQIEVIRNALKLSGLEAEHIGFVETHGTGTNLGDQIEIEALKKAFDTDKKNYCYLGATKTNIGHLDAASGIAGLIKTILVLKHKVIPPLVNFQTENPKLGIGKSPFILTNKQEDWVSEQPRRAGISSFGIGGTNIHMVLEEHLSTVSDKEASDDEKILILSAKNKIALELMKENLYEYIQKNENLDMSALVHTLQTGRDHMACRLSAVFRSREELLDIFKLNAFKSGLAISKNKKIIFAFPGQGMQYANMGKELYAEEVLFSTVLDECFGILKRITGTDFSTVLYPDADENSEKINETINSQPILFSFQYALAKLMISRGIQPDAFIGHSIGEYVAACLSGVISLEDALRLVSKRAEFMQNMKPGKMLAVNLNWKEVVKFTSPSISFASINSPLHCVLSGTTEEIIKLHGIFTELNINAGILKTSHAFHSFMMRDAAEMLENEMEDVVFHEPQIPFISNVTGDWIKTEDCQTAVYWAKQLKSPVQLEKGISKILEAKEVIILELGPGNSIGSFVEKNKEFKESHHVHSIVRHVNNHSSPDLRYLLNKLRDIWLSGVDINWSSFYKSQAKISLPGYGFTHKEFKIDPQILDDLLSGRKLNGETNKNEVEKWFYIPGWKKSTAHYKQKKLDGKWLIIGFDEQLIRNFISHIDVPVDKVYSLVPGLSDTVSLDNHNGFKINIDNPEHYLEFVEHFNKLSEPLTIIDLSFFTPEDTLPAAYVVDFVSYHHLLHLGKAFGRLTRVPEVFLNCLTIDNYDVYGSEQLTLRASYLASTLKVISQEYFYVKSKNIDVSAAELSDLPGLYKRIGKEVSIDSNETVIALRNYTRWIPAYEQLNKNELAPDSKFEIQENSVYLITGGLGNVGFVLAKYLCRKGARVAIIGRTEISSGINSSDSEKLKRFNQLKEIKSDVFYVSTNVADEKLLNEAVQQIEQELGNIVGVFHLSTAGFSHHEDHLIKELSIATCREQFNAKLKGAENIRQVFKHHQVDFVVLFSSIASVLGGIGYFAYAAANACLDRMAEINDGVDAVRWVSINWDAWGTENNGAADLAITENEGNQVFSQMELLLGHGRLVVSVHDLKDRMDRWVLKKQDLPDHNIKMPELERPQLSGDIDLPENQIETELAAIWKSLFGYDTIGVNDDFFELGGDSLKALGLLNSIRRKFEKEISLAEFFNAPSIRAIASLISLLAVNSTGINKATEKETYALSSAQQRLYFLYELDKSSLAYNMPQVVRISGGLDLIRFGNTFKELISRHESLRTSFILKDGEACQLVGDGAGFSIEEYRISTLELKEVIRQFIRPFDLDKGPLIRIGIVSIAEEEHLLLVDMHHIITDGISQGILIRDFMQLYEGEELPSLKLQYKDYSEWQQGEGEQLRIREQKEFWLAEYKVLPDILELPADYARPKKRSYQGGTYKFELDEKTTAALRYLGEQEKSTLFMVLLSVYNIFLGRLGNREDIVVGTPLAGRQHPEIEGIIGMFVNTLALRNYPEGDLKFRDFLRKVRSKTLSCFDNQDFQYEELIEELKLTRDMSRNPLFETVFSYENFETEALEISGLKLDAYDHGLGSAKFDLSLSAVEGADRLYFGFSYSTDLFTESTIGRFAHYLQRVISAIVSDHDIRIADIDILSEEEKYQLLNQHNHSSVSYPEDRTVVSYFEEQVKLYPDRIALVDQDVSLSYQVLDGLSNRLARVLRKAGVGRNSIVGLLTGRTQETVIGMLGILKAGGAYLPMDLDYPHDRISYLLEDSQAVLLLVTATDYLVSHELNTMVVQQVLEQDEISLEALPSENLAEDLCYVIYTSGTTGYPKGVLVEHRNVVRLFFHSEPLFDFGAEDVWTMFHNPYFDFSVWEMYGALLYGGKLVMIPKMVARDPGSYLSLLVSHGVTVLNQTPSAFYNLIEAESYAGLSPDALKLRYVIFGGEALKPLKLSGWYARYPDIALINMFGITETTVHVTYKLITEQEIGGNVSNIGTPIPTLSAYIFDPYQRLVPQGVTGELYVGGAGVSRGYLNRPELNASRFVPNPYRAEERLYRTGDLCRQQANGELEYIGRIDHQVKIRGYRIELGEIESRLLEHDQISDVVVLVREDHENNSSLCAYLVSTEELELSVIRSYLSGVLPDYMVPSHFVQVPFLPQTGNGKVDRDALPAPVPQDGSAYVAAESDLDIALSKLWSSVLQVAEVGLTSNFFSLGGDSMLALKLVSRINRDLGLKMSIADLFTYQCIGELSPRLVAVSPLSDEKEVVAGLLASYDILRSSFLESHPSVNGDDVSAVYPASDIQKGMLYHSMKERGLYHDQMVHVVRYPDHYLSLLDQAMGLLIEKHSILRTGFYQGEEELLQVVFTEGVADIRYQDLSELSSSAQEAFIRESLEQDKDEPFGLGEPGLFRLLVFRLEEGRSCVCLVCHHAIIDGWSEASLNTELHNTLMSLSADPEFRPAGLRHSYLDFVIDQHLASMDGRLQTYWQEALKDYKRFVFSSVEEVSEYRTHQSSLDGALLSGLNSWNLSSEVSVRSLCFSAFVYALYMLSYENDLTVGLVTNNRPALEDGDQILGCFLNTVPFRTSVPEQGSWLSFVQEINTKLNGQKEYERLSFSKIVSGLQEASGDQNPITDVLFNYVDFHVYDALQGAELNEGGGAVLSDGPVADQGEGVSGETRNNSLFNLNVDRTGGELKLSLCYQSNFVSGSTVEQFMSYYHRVLELILSSPDSPIGMGSVLSVQEQEQLLYGFNATAAVYPADQTILDLFVEQVGRNPEAVALSDEQRSMTYEELDQRSSQLANYLHQHVGLEKGKIVGLLIDREIDLIPVIFGVLKAGYAYIPIDVKHPLERINSIIEDSGLSFIIKSDHIQYAVATQIDQTSITDLWKDLNAIDHSRPIVDITGKDLAYIIYTSGSTGRPKGVMIEHHSLVNIITAMDQKYPLSATDKFLLKTNYSFDVSVAEIFGWFLNGGSLCILKSGSENDPSAILDTIEQNRITHINFVPSMFSAFLNFIGQRDLNKIASLKYIFLAGEALSGELVRKFQALKTGIAIENVYGPTEATVYSSAYSTLPNNDKLPVPIGKPLKNVKFYILNASGCLLPRGVAGELYIGGAGVARGYLNNEDLTAERFVGSPYSENQKLYKSGDLAKWTVDGDILFIGRIDNQVKLRGYRIELGEIENQLLSYTGVNHAIVLLREKQGSKNLIAYYSAEQEIENAKLKTFLLNKLPEYMVPVIYMYLENVPLTTSGKIDKKALPDPGMEEQSAYEEATRKEEILLVDIWSKVLGVKKVGIHDNFFSLGGDSIKSIQISSRLRGLGYELSVKSVFNFPVIKTLASKLKHLERLSDQSPVYGEVLLSPVQSWFFDKNKRYRHHNNHAVMLRFERGISAESVNQIFYKLQNHHDALRMVFAEHEGGISQRNFEAGTPVWLNTFDLTKHDHAKELMFLEVNKLQRSIDLENGPLMKLGLFHTNDGSHLLIIIHHLVIDGVSWRILFEDIESLYQLLMENKHLELPLKTDSFQVWSRSIYSYSQSKAFLQAKSYWDSINAQEINDIRPELSDGENTYSSTGVVSFHLTEAETTKLLKYSQVAFGTQINDILLTGLLLSIVKQFDYNVIRIDLESHGRQSADPLINISRTVGWFTSIYPVVLKYRGMALSEVIKGVKEALRNVPNEGWDFLINKYMATDSIHGNVSRESRMSFNYLGQFDQDTENKSYSISSESKGNIVAPEQVRPYDLEVLGLVSGHQLYMDIIYSKNQFKESTLQHLMDHYRVCLAEVIDYCCNYGKTELSPSDLTYKGLTIDQLNHLQGAYNLTDIYSLSPMQRGMLFHALLDKASDNYFEQMTFTVKGNLNVEAVKSSINMLSQRYDILRTRFLYEDLKHPLQMVLEESPVDFLYKDIRDEYRNDSKERIVESFRLKDMSNKFDLSNDSLMRLSVLQTSENEFEFIWSHHHILMDGWCMAIIIEEFRKIYSSLSSGSEFILPPVKPYADYIKWIDSRDKEEAANYWKNYLLFYEVPVSLPKKRKAHTAYFLQPEFSASSLIIDRGRTQAVNKLSRTYGITVNSIIQAVWALLLSKYNNTNDVVFGSVVSGRPAEIENVERMVGLFINTVPVRITYEASDTIAELLKSVQSQALEAGSYHYHPLAEIQALTEPGRDLFDHIMVFENYPLSERLEGHIPEEDISDDIEIDNVRMFEQTNYDLSILVIPGEEISIQFDFNSNVYDPELMSKMVVFLDDILDQVLSAPDLRLSDLDLLSSTERLRLLELGRGAVPAYRTDRTLVELFREQVLKNPDAAAIIFEDQVLSYQELDDLSSRLSVFLRNSGVVSGAVIGLMLDRSPEMIAGILGILKSGAAYVPIDSILPQERILYLLKDSGASFLLTSSAYWQTYQDHISVLDISAAESVAEQGGEVQVQTEPGDLVYIIYTSGSTGKPKGVMVGNTSLINFIESQRNLFEITSAERILQFSTISFDASVEQIWLALLSGAGLVLLSKEVLTDQEMFQDYLRIHEVTHLHATPSFLENIRLPDQNSLKRIIAGGEACSADLANRYKKNYNFYNKYGPTESTISCLIYHVEQSSSFKSAVPIGRAISGTCVYILDQYQGLSPEGALGELCISGLGLSKGYVNNEALTAEKFVSNPFEKDGLMYRTGDLVRWGADGNIEFLGRIDDQVKIRGYRIEPGEIEVVISGLEEINQALVVVKEQGSDKHLVAYYTTAARLPVADLKQRLQGLLPEYMLPSYYVHLSEFPLTSNGKVDRRGLPELRLDIADDYVAASTGLEDTLVTIWSEILKIEEDRISVSKSFFDLGGHSLKAMSLVNRIRKEVGVEVSLKAIFSHQSIRSLSAYIQGMSGGSVYSSIPLATGKGHYALSSAQKRLYFLYEFDRDSLAYNMPQAVWLHGELDQDRLSGAFRSLIHRHEVLRTRIVMIGDEPFQVIGDGSDFSITVYQSSEEEVDAVMSRFIRPFDLGRGLLIRVGLVHVASGTTLMMVDMHHIITDGVSHGILIRDFMALYDGQELSAPGLQYKDYSEWQQSAAEQKRIAEQKSFWLSEYQDLPEALELPLDYARSRQAVHKSGSYGFELDEQTTGGLRRLGEENGATLFMVLLSAYKILLSQLGNREDVVVGIPTAGRRHADLEGVIGIFINMLALRNYPLGSLSFRAFLKEVSSRTLSCFDHQDFQYEDLVDELKLSRDTGRNPLFEATFSYQNFETGSLSIPGLSLSPYAQEAGISKFDLSLSAIEESGLLYLNLSYSRDLFNASTVERFGDYLQQIIKLVLVDPDMHLSEINLLSAAERSHLLELGKGSAAAYGIEKTVVDLFCEQVLQRPDAVAVVFEKRALTYAELDQLSNQLAGLLQSSYQIQAGDAVGISLGGTELLLVGILGILKAGGVYVPFDVDYPAERKAYLCADAGIRLLLTVTDHVFDAVDYYSGSIMALDAELVPDAQTYSRPSVSITGESLAYISYTSGSTGNPKGVMVPHQGILRLLNLCDIVLNEHTVTLQLSSVSFDAATFEIWVSLLSGGKVVLRGDGSIDIGKLNNLIRTEGVNTLWLTSGLLDQWADHDLSGLPLVYLLSGGDVVHAASVCKVYRQLPELNIYNGYGPTENTTFTCCYKIPRTIQADENIPIGRPITGSDVYVLNSSIDLCPDGVAGELCISGLGLARGYVNNEALTAEKFVSNPFEKDGLMYRTGDLVRWKRDGNIEFLGRIDDQVKIRGYRIEPGEIEAVISGLEEVNQTLVMVKEQGGDKHLVAYYTTATRIPFADLKQRLQGLLPDYMLPSYYVYLSEFPLTSNGKVDRRKLPELSLDVSDDYVAASTELERTLTGIWSEVLKIDQDKISVNKSFFDLGGHSLKAMSLANKIHKTFSVDFPISDVFNNPTVKLMAKIIEVQQWIGVSVNKSSEIIKIKI
ncbi:hybrid non-ribosomal peptide synthetase/type I polyketide synthase [Pedobacter steynii]|uniref:Amino acid adenylation domain-containing protein n=1 Tax=Pedobacter steynii TaxID=430522 RepID=A0A1D7QJA9_9SPHI|nr:hybrid non-ribosomal peptide synthetase/type I polyketide synthase [Pedobacter steynii]AOM78758.1 hypothetical protein BFS30_17195 [Pedobacter steynii]